MALPLFLRLPVVAVLVVSSASARSLGWNADALTTELQSIEQLPPAPDGVSDLRFSELFVSPVGPEGLVLTETAKSRVGQRVRLLGFMVEQEQPAPGTVILAPYALATHEEEYGLCDDLPPSVVFIDVPKYRDRVVPFTPGPLLLTGRLEIGTRDEQDGRVSFVRLVLDPEPTGESALRPENQP